MRRHGNAWCIIALFLVLRQPSAFTGGTTRRATPKSIQAFVCKQLLLVCTVESRQVLLLAQRRVELDPVMEKIWFSFVASAVTGAGVPLYKDQQSQLKITHLTIAVEGLLQWNWDASRADGLAEEECRKSRGRNQEAALPARQAARRDPQCAQREARPLLPLMRQRRSTCDLLTSHHPVPVVLKSRLFHKCVTRAFADAEPTPPMEN